jgi:hypothetical protein
MKIIKVAFITAFCIIVMCSCKSTHGIRTETLGAGDAISSTSPDMTVSEASLNTSKMSESVESLLSEQDKGYIEKHGNPDPTVNGKEVEYILTNNKLYFSFRESFSFSPYAHMHVSCFYTNQMITTPMIYRFPSVEWENEKGEWVRLSYLPADIETTENRWIPLVDSDGNITELYDTLAVNIEDIIDPPIGNYRIILYIYGQTEANNETYIKYEIPFNVEALTAYPREPDGPGAK